MEGKLSDTPFLSQLGEFCSNLDKRVSNLKLICNARAGSNPQHYDKGLSIFKSELSGLKVLAETTKSKVFEIQQFAHFTESLQELVSQQADDIKKMENYLEKFGYIVPDDRNFCSNEDPIDQNDSLIEGKNNCMKSNDSEFAINNPNMMTPELSEIGKCILQGKNLPILESLAKRDLAHYSTSSTTPTKSQTPAKSPTASTYEATPISSSVKNINNWLLNVHAEASFAITPNVICEKPRNSLRETNFQMSINQPENTTGSNLAKQLKYPSPLKKNAKPICSLENRISLLHRKGSSMSKMPEEPTLSHVGSFLASNEISKDRNTSGLLSRPKEPNLGSVSCFDRHTPEEPVLSFTRNLSTNKDNTTPEEPVLHFSRNLQARKDNNTPEEPVLLTENFKNQNIRVEPSLNSGRKFSGRTDVNASPCSPQLSDMTQKLLNIRSLHFSDADSTGSISLKKLSPLKSKENQPLLLVPSNLPDNVLQSPQMSDVTLRILNKL